jgi:hypothetical protein
MSTYTLCTLKYYFQYILGISGTETNVAAFLGACVHDTIEKYYLSENKMSHKEMVDSFTEEFESGFLFEDIVTYFPLHKKYSYDMGIRAIDQFLQNKRISNAKPLIYLDEKKGEIPAIELYFKIPLVDLKTGKPYIRGVNLTGLMDLGENRKGKVIVTDHKTSSKEYTEFFIDNSLQLTMYAYATRYMIKNKKFKDITTKKEHIVTYNMFLKPKKDSKLIIIERKVSDSDILNMVRTVMAIDKAITAEAFYPANNDACEAFGGCDFKEICGMYQKRKDVFEDGIFNQELLKEIYGDKIKIKTRK